MKTGHTTLRGWQIAGYGLGDAANNLSFGLGLMFLLHYYTDVAGLSAAAAGSILIGVRIYDAVMDFVAGRIVDRQQREARSGRLRPFLLWGGLPLLLLNLAVFSVPAGWSMQGKLIWATLSYALAGTAYAFVSIPYGSLASVMTQHPRERARLSAARTLAASLTLIVLAQLIAPAVQTLHGEALQDWLTRTLRWLGLCGGLLYLACFMSVREIVERPVATTDWRLSLITLRGNRPLHLLCAAALCLLAGSASVSASALYFARYVLGDASLFLSLMLGNTLFALLLAVPLAPALVTRFGKTRCFQAGSLVAALAHLALGFMPASQSTLIHALFGLASAGVMLASIVMWAMEADTVEYGEWRTGLRLEGANYACFSLTRKCGLALGGALPAFLLAAAGYLPNLPQSEAGLNAIRMSVGFWPALAFALSGLILAFHPLSDSRFLALIAELGARRKN